mmetsp:Transcript_16755/g.32611  ORF Transcript_16755/g.32611 Transcript_16755/m.32611 type:complete len:266 (-) Transcript_16755:261-1058(-)
MYRISVLEHVKTAFIHFKGVSSSGHRLAPFLLFLLALLLVLLCCLGHQLLFLLVLLVFCFFLNRVSAPLLLSTRLCLLHALQQFLFVGHRKSPKFNLLTRLRQKSLDDLFSLAQALLLLLGTASRFTGLIISGITLYDVENTRGRRCKPQAVDIGASRAQAPHLRRAREQVSSERVGSANLDFLVREGLLPRQAKAIEVMGVEVRRDRHKPEFLSRRYTGHGCSCGRGHFASAAALFGIPDAAGMAEHTRVLHGTILSRGCMGGG